MSLSFIGHICSIILAIAEAYPDLCQTLKVEVFVKTANSFQPLTIFAKFSILEFLTGF